MLKTSLAVIAIVFVPAAALAQGTARSGEQIVRTQCGNCHETGEQGAPKIADRDAWVPRLKRGVDAVVASAMNGHGNMPARGGMASLTDAELRSAVVYLFSRSGGDSGAQAVKPQPRDAHRKVVGGTEILLGVVSAESLRGRSAAGSMHGGVPTGRGYFHINISLHDTETNAEITDAEVQARVATALTGDTKPLEPIRADRSVSYGNYFRMPGHDVYRISVTVRRPGSALPIETTFDYKVN